MDNNVNFIERGSSNRLYRQVARGLLALSIVASSVACDVSSTDSESTLEEVLNTFDNTTTTFNDTTTTTELTTTTTTNDIVNSTVTSSIPETSTTIGVENYTRFDFDLTPGTRLGRIYTEDLSINADFVLTDSLNSPSKPLNEYLESPELDYIDKGVGLSVDYGFPGEPGNSVALAHNTSLGMDFFRNLPQVKAGSRLFVEYEKNGYKDLLVYEAIGDAMFIEDNSANTANTYYDGQIGDNYSTLTTYTCNTVNAESNKRAVVVWSLVDILATDVVDIKD